MKRKTPAPETLTLGGGLRLVHLHDPHTCAAIFGICVGAGSADEEPGRTGLAHFVEHTIFKGTARRSSWHIINRMEAVGGELNAYTTKEATVVYSVFPAGALGRAVELIADLALNSRFPDKELDKEREVVIDEINSYLDTPSEAVFDDFEDLFYAGTGLGHNILGTPESVAGLGGADCRAFLGRWYRAGNTVVFYSGPASADKVAAAVSRWFAALNAEPVERLAETPGDVPRFDIVRSLPIHQSHVVAGAAVPGLDSDGRYAAAMLANILGGPGMNSLLNVELRERRGLVYTVEASTTFFRRRGLLNIYFGCDGEDRRRCLDICRRVLESLADPAGGMTQSRLDRARKQYLGQLTLAGENRENRILAAARSVLVRGSVTTDAEVTAALAAVTPADIRDNAARLLDASILSFVPESEQ